MKARPAKPPRGWQDFNMTVSVLSRSLDKREGISERNRLLDRDAASGCGLLF